MKQPIKENFKDFADAMLECAFEGGDMPGGEIQELALEYNLIKEVLVGVPCDDFCPCSEIGFPQICYRKAYK